MSTINYYTDKFDKMSLEEQTNLIYNTCPTLLEGLDSSFLHESVRLWNFVKRKLIRKWTEQDYTDELDDGEYPTDHESWTGKWCDGCKSYMIKGKWVGCEDCDK